MSGASTYVVRTKKTGKWALISDDSNCHPICQVQPFSFAIYIIFIFHSWPVELTLCTTMMYYKLNDRMHVQMILLLLCIVPLKTIL
jgi:hypothetical protein